MADLSLFDATPYEVTPPAAEPVPKLSGDARRRQRQYEAMLGGYHAINTADTRPDLRLRLHPDAAPPADREAAGLRCGSCRFRVGQGHNARTYPKCLWPDPDRYPRGGWPRVTHGPGTDVAAWWPACTDYQPAQVPS